MYTKEINTPTKAPMNKDTKPKAIKITGNFTFIINYLYSISLIKFSNYLILAGKKGWDKNKNLEKLSPGTSRPALKKTRPILEKHLTSGA